MQKLQKWSEKNEVSVIISLTNNFIAYLVYTAIMYLNMKYYESSATVYELFNKIKSGSWNLIWQLLAAYLLKLKVVNGTYILKVNRSSFNQNRIDPTCLMCENGDKNIEHSILDCVARSHIRVPILKEIKDICDSLYPVSDNKMLIQIIVDSQNYWPMAINQRMRSFWNISAKYFVFHYIVNDTKNLAWWFLISLYFYRQTKWHFNV